MFRTLALSTYSLAVRAHSSNGFRNFLITSFAVSVFAAQMFLAPVASAGVFQNTVLDHAIEQQADEKAEENHAAHDCLIPISSETFGADSDIGSAVPLGSAADCAPLAKKDIWI